MINVPVQDDKIGITSNLLVAGFFVSFKRDRFLERANLLNFTCFRGLYVRDGFFSGNMVLSEMPSFQALTIVARLYMQSDHRPLNMDKEEKLLV